MKDKVCPECGNPVFGRVDKKFCSDACRNAYNNRANSSTTKLIRQINNTLVKNRRILMELNPNGKKKTHRDRLLKKGFDFDFFTNSYTTKAGDTYHFCYEHGYLELDEGYVLLVERNESSSTK
ncbi:MAG: hypothetical protein AAGC64_07915 [Bacteroidota bacterium]